VEIWINNDNFKRNILTKNPSDHEEIQNGFSCKLNDAFITWVFKNKKLKIYFDFNENKKDIYRKFFSIQYTHPYEDIGQIFHELVLIPTLFFYPDDISIIHGSAVQTKEKKAVLIGGTGGVGKTSLELSLIQKNNFKFLADDITIIDKNTNLWPNYAFPKIYRYNTQNREEIEKKVLKNRGFFDRFQWNFFKLFPNKPIRRRINPKLFYDNKIGDRSKLTDYFILFKGNFKDFSMRKISAEKAAFLNLEIVKVEYLMFLKHIYWHRINRAVLKDELILDEETILKKWLELQKKALKKCNCNLVEIPINYNIVDIEEKMLSILKD
jgi:hypothetical protein